MAKPPEQTLEEEVGIYYTYSFNYSYDEGSDSRTFGALSFGATVFGGDTEKISDLFLVLTGSGDGNYSSTLTKERFSTLSGAFSGILSETLSRFRYIDSIYSSSANFTTTLTKIRAIQKTFSGSANINLAVDRLRIPVFSGSSTSSYSQDIVRTRKLQQSYQSPSNNLDIISKKTRIFDFGLQNTSDLSIEQTKKRAFVYEGDSEATVKIAVVVFNPDSDEIVRLSVRELPRSIVNERDVVWDIENEQRVLDIAKE